MILLRLSLLLSILSVYGFNPLRAQLVIDGDTLYGNEWINYDQTYFKLKVADDGIYRVNVDALRNGGFPVDVRGEQIQLWHLGKEHRIHVSSEGALQVDDYLEFYGERNRSQLDRHLFADPDRMLNPEYSMYSDTSAYYVTWQSQPSTMRYTSVDNDLTGDLPPKKEAYIHHEKIFIADVHLIDPIGGFQNIAFSTYESAEGFASKEAVNLEYRLPASHVADDTNISPQIRFRLAGNTQPHDITIKWNNQRITNLSFSGTQLIDSTLLLAPADVENTNVFACAGKAPGERFSIATLELTYPHTFDFDERTVANIELTDVRGGAYLEMENFGGEAPPLVYDLTGSHRIVAERVGSTIKINLPLGPINRKVVVVDPINEIKVISKIESTSFRDLNDSDATYIIISNNALRNDENGQDWVQAYANYRQSPLGGKHTAQIVDIAQLVDQFAYGIHLHPYSIKNFTNYIYKHWNNPQFLFLIGKGLEYGGGRKVQLPYEYLPVFGSPGSDNLMTSRGRNSTPLIPVGRIAVRSATEIATYLSKVKKMDEQIANAPRTLADRGWMKRGIHLAGGNNQGEKNSILSSLDLMADRLQEDSLGIKIRTFTKESNDVIEGRAEENAQSIINEGVLVKSYFGHGGVSSTQFQGLEDPFFLSNKDRYPLMLALGCYTGNIFSQEVSLGESNVLIGNKGAITYIATSGLGVLFALNNFGATFYGKLGEDFYLDPVGKAFQASLRTYEGTISSSVLTLIQQLTYHGDPAIILSMDNLPDYVPDQQSLTFSPAIVDRALDSFEISFDLINIGKNQDDSVRLKLNHRTPTNVLLAARTITVLATSSCTNIRIKLPMPDRADLVGVNRLLLEVDPNNDLEEMTPGGRANNQLQSADGTPGVPFIIAESGIQPLFPPKYAIYNADDISLIAQTFNAIEKPANYIFQIDTTALYDSPILVSETLMNRSGIISWQPGVQAMPDKVYYWRARRAQSDTIVWMQSSFTYAPDDRNGFDQRHYYQFLENDLTGLYFDSISRQTLFVPAVSDFQLKIQAKYDGGLGAGGFVNGSRWTDFYREDIDEGITFVVNDPENLYGFLFNPNPGLYESVNRRSGPIAAFPFPTSTPAQRKSIIDFIENVIPDDAVVFAYTTQANDTLQLNVGEWREDSVAFAGKNLFNVFESVGANAIRSLETGGMRPYLLVFQKNKGLIDEIAAMTPQDTIQYPHTLQRAANEGSMRSVRIGPAASWAEMVSDIRPSTDDSTIMEIFGEDRLGSTNLLETLGDGLTSFDLSNIDANQFHYLKIRTHLFDAKNHDPAQFNRWTVYYEGYPDLAFDFAGSLSAGCDTLLGQNELSLTIPISNYSPYHWPDSFDLQVSISDGANQEVSKIIGVPPIDAGASVTIPVNFDLEELTGQLLLTAVINGEGLQNEQYAQNNTMSKCYVRPGDDVAPVLEVLFSGKRIMDGELIAAKPDILISLNDESTTSLLIDSALFDIYYVDPTGERVQVDIFSPEITFTPASDSSNVATVRYEPTFEQEGDYQFFVNARDNNNNRAGESAYSVHFKISNEQSVGDLLPYPNPFTTHCRFLYTVHGSIIPEAISIRIFTLSGQVVKEITSTEIGPLQVGSNLTDYVWDGTDNYGDKLANGVYLYKVRSESDIKNKQTDNAFFEKGLGKLTILR